MASDQPLREGAIERFVALAGSPKDTAATLVDSALQASQDQFLELIAGTGPIPSNMTAARADQLRYVCLRTNRILDQREVEVLFRTTSSTARNILTHMRATYEESLREQFLTRMREDVTVIPSGSAEDGLTWTLAFTESATFELGLAEVQRLGLNHSPLYRSNPTRKTLVVQQVISDGGKKQDVLGLIGLSDKQPGQGS